LQRFFSFLARDFLTNPPRLFILPLYVEDEAQAQATMVSPPRIRNQFGYDHDVGDFVDDEVLK
jgi:hypothetical protein